MTVLLVLATFATYIAIERFTHKPAMEFGPQAVTDAPAALPTAQLTSAEDGVSNRRRAENDRRQAERRSRAA